MTWAFPLSPGVRRPETSFRHQQEWGRAAESGYLFQLSALSRSRDRSVPQVAPDHSERGSQRGSDLDFHGKSDAQSFGLLCPLPELLHQSRPPSSARQGGAQCVGWRGSRGKRGNGEREEAAGRAGRRLRLQSRPRRASGRPRGLPQPCRVPAESTSQGRVCLAVPAAPVIYLRAAWKAWRGRRRGSGAQHLRPLFHVLAAARHLTGAAPATPATQSGSALEQSCACVPVKLREALF